MTAPRWTGGKLIIASHNPGKLREIADLLQDFAVETVSAQALNLPEPDETADSFIGNAELKARAAAQAAGLPALADDSGLSVTALGGAPGIYSARWAGPDKDFALAMQRVQDEVGDAADRSCAFVCALSLAWPDGRVASFEGRVQGQLVWPPRGTQGFGYDPLFLPDGYAITFGEFAPAAKHAISHRAQAFAQLVDAVFRPARP